MGTSPATGAALPDLTGRILGDYQILRRLGVGGMGQVYLARQLSLKRDVALKLLRDDLNANPTALARFQAEAEAVAKLNHPNIVHIHQIGESDGLRYMALEYVEGRNLRDHLARKGPPELPVTLSIVRQVVLALQQAHEHGIVHRDVKPENILVTKKVEVKVTDFGLSRFFSSENPTHNLTQSGVTLGTPLYMSPEQVQGHQVDHRSDLYSLGVTCYHVIAGEPPFRGATAFDVALKHLQEEPQPLTELCSDVPADLCAMVHKMMAKNPADRYQTAREILRDLARVRDCLAQAASRQQATTSGPIPLAQPVPLSLTETQGEVALRRGWLPWAIGLFVCLVAAGGGVLFAFSNKTSPNPAPVPPAAATTITGLTEIRPTEKFVTSRERELLALVSTPGTKPEDLVQGSIELGLLYVRERRLSDAQERFKKLEHTTGLGTVALNRSASTAGRLGQAVVLAHRDHKADAEKSNELFLKVINESHGKNEKKAAQAPLGIVGFLLKHVDLSQAVSEALNRNAAVLGKSRLDPPVLELLRSPPRSTK